ncbi:MAG TPA: hydrogenase iron-sulfur subunit [Acidobacteriaceae bacterium]|nr:hydrogenase iron-sulfur subunit [Acidobacteriaceae bacterium]
MSEPFIPKILVLATEKCAYPGADAVGKAHQEYPSNVYILRVLSPVLFPEDFYLRAYSQGIDGILIAACGSDCPYHGAYDRLAARIDELTSRMSAGGLGIERIRLTAICTVCIKAFLKEIALMSDHLQRLGPVDRKLAEQLRRESVRRLQASARYPRLVPAMQGGLL